jgi:hypothetical protein
VVLVSVLGVLFLGVLVLELELVLLMLFGTGGNMAVLFGEDTNDVGDNFAVDYGRLRCRCRIPWLGGWERFEEFVWFTPSLESFWAESFAVNERAI